MTSDDLRRFWEGDHGLFRELVERHSPRLLSLARAYAADLDEAHDLVQETWIRAYNKRTSFAGRGTILGWLLAVCRSLCLSHQRSSKARRGVDAGHPASSPDLTAGSESPETDLERAGLRRSLAEALFGLPERQREVVVCRLVEGRSTRETARLMGCAEGTVKAALHAAVHKLRAHMIDASPAGIGAEER